MCIESSIVNAQFLGHVLFLYQYSGRRVGTVAQSDNPFLSEIFDYLFQGIFSDGVAVYTLFDL